MDTFTLHHWKKRFVYVGIALCMVLVGAAVILTRSTQSGGTELSSQEENQGGLEEERHPFSIEYMRQQTYPGSELVVEQTLPASPAGGPPGSNYDRFLVSYKSDGLKIYALLTVPQGTPSTSSGWPVVIFNHGYIPPAEYRTTERYVAYVDAFAKNGYIVFKPDYRGH